MRDQSRVTKSIRTGSMAIMLKQEYGKKREKRSPTHNVHVCIAWYKHKRGWENLRQLCKPEKKSRVCITVKNSPNPSSVYIRLCKHRKKVFCCFYKIFLKIIGTIEGKFCFNFLIQKDFLLTCSRQSSFLLTNRNSHLIMHEPKVWTDTFVNNRNEFSNLFALVAQTFWVHAGILLGSWSRLKRQGRFLDAFYHVEEFVALDELITPLV